MKKEAVVLYHNDCFDGFSGAWVAWKKFGKKAKYIGLEHQEPPPKGLVGNDLFFIDFTYSASQMRAIKKKARRLVVLDHHESHKGATQVAHEYRFSLDYSGCMLAWMYFFSRRRAPHFLQSVQDQDLFVFRKPYTREIISYLGARDQDFHTWDTFMKAGENNKKRREIISIGATLLRARQKMVERTLPYAMPVLFEGYRTLAINSPVYYSELANGIYSKLKKPFGISWYYRDHKIHVSLRSDGKIDVSKFAVKYGGGGHRGASGFTVPIKKDFPWKFL
ncbi:hypothetical protein HY621_00125 [Candidatus Uhrbacteria bacterium]|nr:hypothetical protein [Candidatus Uhrbacteria bacterium]